MSRESCIKMGEITAPLYALGKDSIQVRQADDVEDREHCGSKVLWEAVPRLNEPS